MQPKRILITGGAGFIGANFVRHVLANRPSWSVVNLDVLSYSGSLTRLSGLDSEPRHRFVKGDICDEEVVGRLMSECDAVVHLAAESHVDRSIADSRPFIVTNVLGTHVLLEAARKRGVRLVYVSTDEVYGSLTLDATRARFTEDSPMRPNSPYAASKAGADLLCRAYVASHGADVVVARCSNNMGPYQHPEKLIPLFVTNLIEGRRVPLYGDGLNVRDWVHVDDHCAALLAILERGRSGEAYNIGAGVEKSNLELTREILRIMGRPESMIEHVADRPGHDRRYAVDSEKIMRELGWKPTRSSWPAMLEETVRWYLDHSNWWRSLAR
ncbi:MAG: dTDP-glucose 4,6-dehydratase [Phycisphaerae bacterium]|nr:dTDP-glucose 4,6-dehydratase [Phycisphaerae bacterium]